MKDVYLDASRFSGSRKEIHEYVASVFAFPDYYGCNLDALFDMLTSVMDETAVYIRNMDQVEENSYGMDVLMTILDSAKHNVNLKVIRK